MRRAIAALAAVILLAFPAPRLHAWGFTAHRYLTDHAVDLLPPEIRPFFVKYRVAIVEHSIDPDTYRTVGWAAETPRHFLDMDAWGAFPFTAIPHDYNEAVAKRGQDFVLKNGTLPWRGDEMYRRLVDSFQKINSAPYARDDVKLFTSLVAHYVEDAYQPLHANVNFDGQLTGQNGIHSRFETELFERYSSRLHVVPPPLQSIGGAREFMFATLADSFQLSDDVLAADRAAIAGRDEYDDAYFDAFLAKIQPVLERRVSQAISGVASVISAAWIEAGKPALPADAPPRAPKKVIKSG